MGGSESGLIQRQGLKRPYLFILSILCLCHYQGAPDSRGGCEGEPRFSGHMWQPCPAEFQTLYRLMSLGIVCYTTGVNSIVHKQALGYKIKVWL